MNPLVSPTSTFDVQSMGFPEKLQTRYWEIDGTPLSEYSWPLVKVNGIEPEIWLYLTSPVDFWRADSLVKEHYTLAWMREHMKPGDVFYDVGSNIGVMSMAAQVAVGGLEIHAFEPVYMNLGQMTRNLVLNRLNDNIHGWPFALWDEVGVQTIALNGAFPGTSLQTFETNGPGYHERVVTQRLDGLWELGIPFPNHIKIDVDGVEGKIMDGATFLLDNSALRTVQIEINHILHDEEVEGADRIYQMFEDFGFKLERKSPHGSWCGVAMGDLGVMTDIYDCLFVRS